MKELAWSIMNPIIELVVLGIYSLYIKPNEPKIKKHISRIVIVVLLGLLIIMPIGTVIYTIIKSKVIDKSFVFNISFNVALFFFNVLLIIIIRVINLNVKSLKVSGEFVGKTKEGFELSANAIKTILDYIKENKK